ncbi:hypothetical protein BGZ61DRAFT_469701 [Ilyonectria robusta]|uniref:uncharacterized protein n=1 Tax=Ilyonectria robusta TaxID=1079257 RepID=UPI001E8E36AE|nr:uncharacterized protein BGZ61DRAFT_469701 [Ilyonectria robusta]KAH8648819.1 hypothetical protein BGZ61DRAFT_469701 [Ilyonectria robusta]
MNTQDQADNLHSSSIGPIRSLNDFDLTNHTVWERPEDLNQDLLNLRKKPEELSPSGSGTNYLRLVCARKAGKSFLSRAIGLGRDGKTSCVVCFWDLNSQSWAGTRSIAENNPDANAEGFPYQAALIRKRGRTLENTARRLGRTCGVPCLVAYYSPSARGWTGLAYVPWDQPTPDWNCILETI